MRIKEGLNHPAVNDLKIYHDLVAVRWLFN
jgi:hypothetical protein